MATTNGSPSSLDISVESHFGKRSGSASGTDLSDDALAALVAAVGRHREARAGESRVHAADRPAEIRRRAPAFPPRRRRRPPTCWPPRSSRCCSRREAKNLQASGFLEHRHGFLQLRQQQRAFRLRPGHAMFCTRSPRARPTAPARAGPARRTTISARSMSPAWARWRSTRRSARKSRCGSTRANTRSSWSPPRFPICSASSSRISTSAPRMRAAALPPKRAADRSWAKMSSART